MNKMLHEINKWIELNRIRREEQERIEQEKAAEAERLEQERIQAEKEAMASMSERELLVEMLSIARETKRRLDKLETRFDEFESCLEAIDPDCLCHDDEYEEDEDEDEDSDGEDDGAGGIEIKFHGFRRKA